MQSGYEICLYRPELLSEIVMLLNDFWGGNYDDNVSYFQWKYHDNPYSDRALGIVALHKDRIVGFRGYFASKWHIPEQDRRFLILGPGDTYVDPEHRMAGLSVKMGGRAMEEFESGYQVFFNTSASVKSLPGYLRMGFIPLANKTFLKRYNIVNLFFKKYLFTEKKRAEASEGRIKFGAFNDIIVSESPRPEEMSSVISERKADGNMIKLFQDEKFFRWRFNNKKNKYIFYYFKKENIIKGYVVILVSDNNWNGFIVDYAENCDGALKNILRYIIQKNHVDILTILNVSLNESFYESLKDIGFRADNLMAKREIKKHGIFPFLIRPVKSRITGEDWFIKGLDIRAIRNWNIKWICHDAL
ncbi:MAG: GNAT family N-acetyltransferase [Nitrospira sp.]|nr:GNAT family N-acetyltransferase [Nitrospira sp.]